MTIGNKMTGLAKGQNGSNLFSVSGNGPGCVRLANKHFLGHSYTDLLILLCDGSKPVEFG